MQKERTPIAAGARREAAGVKPGNNRKMRKAAPARKPRRPDRVARMPASGVAGRSQSKATVRQIYREREQRILEGTEEFRAANLSLEAERQRFLSLLEELPAIVCLLAPDYTYRFVNRRFLELFGDPQQHPCFQTKSGRNEPCPHCPVSEVFKERVPIEWQWTSPAGRIYQLYHCPFMEADGSLSALELGIDITERTEMAERLQKSEENYRMLVESMSDGLGVMDENQVLTYVNDRICEMLEYSRDEIIGRPAADFVDESHRAVLEEQKTLRSQGQNRSYEAVWVGKDGRKVPTIVSPKAIFGSAGRFTGSFGIVTDITERKRAEEALRESEKQLRSLSAQLLRAQESQRASVSRELHDELGQGLNTLKLRLALICRKLRKDQAPLKEDCEETLGYIDGIIEEVRRLSRDLSPRALEDLGLVAALRRLIHEFAKRTRTKVSMQIDDINGFLSKDAEIFLYRIVQEALTNIGKHAGAARVSIRIERLDDSVHCVIEDNGKGFDLEPDAAADSTEKGMGIAIMKERIRMLGGSLDLWSQPGGGTRISFLVPAGSPEVP